MLGDRPVLGAQRTCRRESREFAFSFPQPSDWPVLCAAPRQWI